MSVADQVTRDVWLDWRRQGVGASDVAGIIGISPWASPWSVWADKAGLLPPEPENEAMAAGRWLEAAIGPWFTHETGLIVAGEQMWCTHKDHPHHRCTVDGLAFDGGRPVPFPSIDRALGAVEIKVTGPGRRWDEPPAHYAAQVQWQMHVTGLDRAWLAVLMGRRLDIHLVERDQADIDFMVERVEAFWRDHVLTGTPPATDGHDATLRAIAAVHPAETPGEQAEVDAGLVQAWRDASRRKTEAARDEKAAKAELLTAIGDAEVGTVDGQVVLTCRSQTRTTNCTACGHKTESDPFRVLRAKKETTR